MSSFGGQFRMKIEKVCLNKEKHIMDEIIDNGISFDSEDLSGYTLVETECLYNTEIDKYIVRLYREKQQKQTWCGIGVIVGNFLITVAHVMRDKKTKEKFSYLYFQFDGQTKRVDSSDIVFDGRAGLDDDVDNIHQDLIIFKLVEMNSPFELNTASFALPLDVFSWKFDDTYSSQKGENRILWQKGYRQKNNNKEDEGNPEWKNCLLVTGEFISGNSGTPIFCKNIIYGVLIGRVIENYPYEIIKPLLKKGDSIYNFLDARYIQEIITHIK